ncbi:MAG: BON domain-containing protein [Planctomycetaceae bacterium]|nr:BON domain-containing protein [Planctomycetaceae bacterium]
MSNTTQESGRSQQSEATLDVAVPPLEAPHDMPLSECIRALIERRGGLCRNLLRISEKDGEIVLEGEVRRYHDRQVALACAQHVPGVRRVIDRIRVCDRSDRDTESN